MGQIEPLWQLEYRAPYNLLVEDPEYVKFVYEKLKHEGALAVFDEIYKANHPIVVETHIEEWDDPSQYCRVYKLHYRLTAVRYRNVELPVFTFVNHEGDLEWKCPACSTINKIKATYCGEEHRGATGCGRPRDKVRQEMYAQDIAAL